MNSISMCDFDYSSALALAIRDLQRLNDEASEECQEAAVRVAIWGGYCLLFGVPEKISCNSRKVLAAIPVLIREVEDLRHTLEAIYYGEVEFEEANLILESMTEQRMDVWAATEFLKRVLLAQAEDVSGYVQLFRILLKEVEKLDSILKDERIFQWVQSTGDALLLEEWRTNLVPPYSVDVPFWLVQDAK